MAAEQKPLEVGIIALDFYDGATEGFASLEKHGPCYFKLIAWDKNEDQRLFVAISITRWIFETVIRLLSVCNDLPSTKVWLPKWIFNNAHDEAEADKIIKSSYQVDLKSKAILVLGDQIDSASAKIFTIEDSLVGFVERAMQQQPDNLGDWLVKLREI